MLMPSPLLAQCQSHVVAVAFIVAAPLLPAADRQPFAAVVTQRDAAHSPAFGIARRAQRGNDNQPACQAADIHCCPACCCYAR